MAVKILSTTYFGREVKPVAACLKISTDMKRDTCRQNSRLFFTKFQRSFETTFYRVRAIVAAVLQTLSFYFQKYLTDF